MLEINFLVKDQFRK